MILWHICCLYPTIIPGLPTDTHTHAQCQKMAVSTVRSVHCRMYPIGKATSGNIIIGRDAVYIEKNIAYLIVFFFACLCLLTG